MTIQGTIHIEGDTIFVKYVTTYDSEPVQQTCYWRVDRVVRSPYAIGYVHPAQGDVVTSNLGSNGWSGKGYSVHFPGDRKAERVDRDPVECPKTRGKPTRWHQGRWEKLMARGWMPA